MKVSVALTMTVLCACIVSAHPVQNSDLPSRQLLWTPREALALTNSTSSSSDSNRTQPLNSTSPRWAGAVLPFSHATFSTLASAETARLFTSVTATLHVPSIPLTHSSNHSNSSTNSSAPLGSSTISAYIALDGLTPSQPAILRAGIYTTTLITAPNVTTHSHVAYAHWLPGPRTPVFNFPLAAGSPIRITLHGNNSMHALAKFENLATGKTAWKELSASAMNSMLSGQTAGWVVEDDSTSGEVADFGRVEYGDASVLAKSGFGRENAVEVDLTNAEAVDVNELGRVMVSTTEDSVAIDYVRVGDS